MGDPVPEARKVFVTGCFDLLHSGHVAFLSEAARYGDLIVGIGSDENVKNLKGRYPVYTQQERQYLLQSLSCVKKCIVNSGWGIMDFLEELDAEHPDILFVNEDGNNPEKEELCRSRHMEYIVSRRVPHGALPVRSTTALRTECNIPYRIDIAGGWLDQPFVSKFAAGPVLTISLEPTIEFNDRSGMASSTRRKAVDLWKTDIPGGDREQLAKVLFSYDNPPGTEVISGSQDAIGIVLPGLNRLNYNGGYWPESIESCVREDVLEFIENHLSLVTLGPRKGSYVVLSETAITAARAKNLARGAEKCWEAMLAGDLHKFGASFTESFEAQVSMFPRMMDASLRAVIEKYRSGAAGWKLSGAGGGGYLILVAEERIPGTMGIKIRRP
ncbi:MAG TPA: adenylyltransferase/cytidyltransferase family protein [Bacteroidota bacterium]|nr:adenylyltransferase/cytidyltransferase family protein [Bacteroidota bacterium]